MKIEGLGTLVRRGVVRIKDAAGASIDLAITAYPLGFHTDLIRDLPGPVAPLKKIGQGKDGPIMDRNEKEPRFLAETARRTHLQTIALAHAALRNEPRVKWDAKRETFDAPMAFYEAIAEEAAAAGLTMAAVNAISAAAVALSNLDAEDAASDDQKAADLFTEADPE